MTYRTISPGGDHSLVRHPANLVILLAIILVVLEEIVFTVPGLAEAYPWVFKVISFAAFSVFTLEYGVRLWTSPMGSLKRPVRALCSYAVSFMGFLGLIVIIPYLFNYLIALPSWYIMMSSFFNMIKLARYVPELRIFISVFRN